MYLCLRSRTKLFINYLFHVNDLTYFFLRVKLGDTIFFLLCPIACQFEQYWNIALLCKLFSFFTFRILEIYFKNCVSSLLSTHYNVFLLTVKFDLKLLIKHKNRYSYLRFCCGPRRLRIQLKKARKDPYTKLQGRKMEGSLFLKLKIIYLS